MIELKNEKGIKRSIAFIANNAGAGQLFKWWITLFSGEIEIGRSEFSSFGEWGGLNFPDLGGGWSEFSGPGFSKFGACGGRGLGEGGI